MRLIAEKHLHERQKQLNFDYKGTLEFSSANGYAQSEAFLSLERGGENEGTRLSFYTTSKGKVSAQPHTSLCIQSFVKRKQ